MKSIKLKIYNLIMKIILTFFEDEWAEDYNNNAYNNFLAGEKEAIMFKWLQDIKYIYPNPFSDKINLAQMIDNKSTYLSDTVKKLLCPLYKREVKLAMLDIIACIKYNSNHISKYELNQAIDKYAKSDVKVAIQSLIDNNIIMDLGDGSFAVNPIHIFKGNIHVFISTQYFYGEGSIIEEPIDVCRNSIIEHLKAKRDNKVTELIEDLIECHEPYEK